MRKDGGKKELYWKGRKYKWIMNRKKRGKSRGIPDKRWMWKKSDNTSFEDGSYDIFRMSRFQ